jgi:hypothetical protein
MRRFVALAAVSLLALAAVGAADARPARTTALDTETLELSRGNGLAVVSGRGALFGHLDSGVVRITDLPSGADTTIVVAGDDRDTRDIDAQTTEYRGTDLTFRLVAGNWRVRISGEGVVVSAVLKGVVGLRGDGRFSIDGSTPRPWPETFRLFTVGG